MLDCGITPDLLFGLDGNTIGAQKPKNMSLNRLGYAGAAASARLEELHQRGAVLARRSQGSCRGPWRVPVDSSLLQLHISSVYGSV